MQARALSLFSRPLPRSRRDPPVPAYSVSLGKALVLRLAAYSVLLLFLAAGVFSALTGVAGPGRTEIGWVQPLLYVVVYFGAMVAHELVHGLFFRLSGGRPRYGAGIKYLLPYFYATSAGAFTPRRMITIALAPLLALSTLSVAAALLAPALVDYLAVIFIGNAAGAVGDIWMVSRLVRFLRLNDASVVDLADGMVVHSRDSKALEVFEAVRARDERPPGFVVQWICAALAALAVTLVAGLVGQLLTDSLLIGPSQFPLIAFTATEQGFEWTVGLPAPLLAGLLFALGARLFSRRAARSLG